MNARSKKRCVLVALDRSPHGRAALDRATSVASQLQAEVVGVYVEDEELAQLAELPFACEIGSQGGSVRALNTESMRKRVRAQAALVRRDLEDHAEAHSVRATFILRRGSVTEELLAACKNADYLVVGRSRRQTRSSRLGATASALARSAGRPVWLAQPSRSPNDTVLLIVDGKVENRETVATCLRIIDPNARLVIAIVSNDSAPVNEHARTLIEQQLTAAKRSAEYVWLSKLDEAGLAIVVARLGDPIVATTLPDDEEAANRVAAVVTALACNVIVLPAPGSTVSQKNDEA